MTGSLAGLSGHVKLEPSQRLETSVKKLFEKIKEEFVAMLSPTIFFFISLQLVAVIRVLMLKGTGIAVSSRWQTTIAALILAKAVLIADLMPFINLYPQKPLIYNVAWKTAIYLLIATLLHYTERLVEFWKATGSSRQPMRKCLRRSSGRTSGPCRSCCWS